MYARVLDDVLVFESAGWRNGVVGFERLAVPGTAHVCPLDDLAEAAGIDVPNLDKASPKENDVRRVESRAFRKTIPFDD